MSCKECNFRYDCPDVFTPIAVYCNNYDKDQENKKMNEENVKDYWKMEDTIAPMLSDDWKERLKAEYVQLRIRIIHLESFIRSGHHLGDVKQLAEQLNCMNDYKIMLLIRMLSADIRIPRINNEDL